MNHTEVCPVTVNDLESEAIVLVPAGLHQEQ